MRASGNISDHHTTSDSHSYTVPIDCAPPCLLICLVCFSPPSHCCFTPYTHTRVSIPSIQSAFSSSHGAYILSLLLFICPFPCSLHQSDCYYLYFLQSHPLQSHFDSQSPSINHSSSTQCTTQSSCRLQWYANFQETDYLIQNERSEKLRGRSTRIT